MRIRTRGVLALFAVVGVLLAQRWLRHDDGSARPPVPVAAPTASATPAAPGNAPAAASPLPSPAPVAGLRSAGAPSPRETPRVVDLAELAPAPKSNPTAGDEDRFATNGRFTEEDRRHPERYFELAERIPELNRPEERRETLEYFRAYRRKLQRDVDVGRDAAERREILATIARYDAAIARLRRLIDRPEGTTGTRDRTD